MKSLFGDRLLIKVEEEETISGLSIPKSAQEKSKTGEVIAVGTGFGESVKVGDKIVYAKYGLLPYEDNLYIIDGEDVLGII
jgi:chaperonin GroES